MAGVSREEAQEVLGEPKVITVNLSWRREQRGYKLDAAVLAPMSGRLLQLRGNVGVTNRSFALLYKNYPIRKYTAHQRHRNPSGELISGPHKHTWDDVDEDEWAYVPEDIRFGDPNEELLDFLSECNIELLSSYGIQTLFQ